MINSASPETDPKIKDATERIDAFSKRFTEAHLYLAYHAAFPLALTPDLLYRLRDYRFQPQIKIPWIAVADLLLSSLCYEVGQELYEMDSTVRQVLLSRLTQDPHFGSQRLEQLSEFLLKYIERQIHHSDFSDLMKAQQWTALAYVKPTQAAHEITLTLTKLLQQQNQSNWLQMAVLVETLAQPLTKAGFQPLLTLARGMAKSARGDTLGAAVEFANLRQLGDHPTIAGVTLNVPPPVPAKIFTFDVVTVNAQGQEIERERRQARYFAEDLGNGITLEMVAIPSGTFLMGSPETEAERYDDEGPQHWVTLDSFFMGKYPITQAQWQAVAAFPQVNRELDPDPSSFKGSDRPVETISWYDADEFCARLAKATGRDYRLPSEAEWEYACRAGTTTPFHFGETITPELANYDGDYTYGAGSKGEYRQETTPVGKFKVTNAFGLFDMHGNVWEWCADHWQDNYESSPLDGSAWFVKNDNDNHDKLLRGGSWYYNPRSCRSAFRNCHDPDNRFNNFGFRVVVSRART